MKKYFALVLALLLLSSCTFRKIGGEVSETAGESSSVTPPAANTSDTEDTQKITEAVTTEETVLEPVVPVGIYHITYCDVGTREDYALQTSFKDTGELGRDLCVFAMFPSLEQTLTGTYFKYIWEDAVEKNPASDGLKVGYFFEYNTPEGRYAERILRPADITDTYWDFVEVYIYDDVNQELNTWYSHLLDSEMREETLITSFKITAGARIGEVTDMKLTAFLYDPAEAGEIDGDYIAHHGYTVTVIPSESR